jgi:hypothetical protein
MPARRIKSPVRQTLLKIDLETRRAVRNTLFDTGDELQDKVETAVSDWSKKPRFKKQVQFSAVYMSVEITPTGRNATIFGYVDQGTDGPYPIPKFPRVSPETGKPMRLTFRTGYSARTAPVAKHHQGSGRASGPFVSPVQVMHPGIEAREFLVTFEEELRPTLNRRIDNAIRAGLRRVR